MSRILFVIDGLSKGGAERVTTWLANQFSELTDTNVTLLVNFKFDGEYPINKNVKIIYIESQITDSERIVRIYKKIRYIFHVIKEGNFEAVISLAMPQLNCYISLACLRYGVRLIVSERNDPQKYPPNKFLRLGRYFCYFIAESVVFQTQGAKQFFPKYVQKKGYLIDNPLMDNLPVPYVGERNTDIVNFCRLTKQKNLTMLIDAFSIVYKKHPEMNLKIFGDGELHDSLVEYIKELGLSRKIFILPFISNIHEVILKASMYVSSSDYEGVSNSMLEAMAIGLPCICTDCPPGGAREFIINRKNGILTTVGDVTQLSQAMLEIIDNPDFQMQIGKSAQNISTRLNSDKIFLCWKKVIFKNRRK
jgi:GalNAc-alpha-(1->4)-GalNAc-alpha-(1->3)-diNAcBac-PP-undecaprenol alpha-1,4-N-acetyl-D-galactosaminyltransferase|nr:glycosyltransferase [uncultured Acetatifactor sp.]